MMKAHTIVLVALLVFQTACVPSVNPLYTEQDLIFDRALLGVWTDDEKTETWEFTFSDEKVYKLVHTDEDGKLGEFKARLLKIEGRTFLDIAPVKSHLSGNDFFKGHILPVHSFVQVSNEGRTFQLSYLEPKWLKPFLENNPTAVRYTMIDGEILFTDSSKNMQKFIASNVSTPGAFSNSIRIQRKEPAK